MLSRKAKRVTIMPEYESWLREVRAKLASINMPLEDWQEQRGCLILENQFHAGRPPGGR